MQNFKEYATYYDLIYKDKEYKKEADMVYEWADKPKTILELGSGTGKHARYWKKKGSIVHMIDRSDRMASNTEFHLGDIRNFPYEIFKPFDACFAMFNVVGYADLIYYMDKLPIKEGGYFIFDCWDSDTIKVNPPLKVEQKFSDFIRKVIPLPVDYSPYLRLEIAIIKNKKPVVLEDHIVRSYSDKEIWSLAETFGFKPVDVKFEKGWVRWYKLRKV